LGELEAQQFANSLASQQAEADLLSQTASRELAELELAGDIFTGFESIVADIIATDTAAEASDAASVGK
jgi:hypothetical protein